jgi:hypothetical protein
LPEPTCKTVFPKSFIVYRKIRTNKLQRYQCIIITLKVSRKNSKASFVDICIAVQIMMNSILRVDHNDLSPIHNYYIEHLSPKVMRQKCGSYNQPILAIITVIRFVSDMAFLLMLAYSFNINDISPSMSDYYSSLLREH